VTFAKESDLCAAFIETWAGASGLAVKKQAMQTVLL
jgi:hypothetical protein